MYILRTLVTLRKNQHDEMMRSLINKISRWISKKFDVNEHINNISSYRLSFLEKLIICRGLKFSLPQQRELSPSEVLACFEKAYWKIEPSLKDPDKKELGSSTLRSIELNYIKLALDKQCILARGINLVSPTQSQRNSQILSRLDACV